MSHVGVLNSSVLVLNKFFAAVHVTSARRALTLLYKDCAEVVSVNDGQFERYNFETWKEVSKYKEMFDDAEDGGEYVRTVSFDIRVPRVIRLLFYDKFPSKPVKLNRRNVYARDGSRCQYCGGKYSTSELSIDHVVPRSRGGLTTWENVVCACTDCNAKKGGRLPSQAGLRLRRKPKAPRRSPLIRLRLNPGKYGSWKQFLNEAYWSVELK